MSPDQVRTLGLAHRFSFLYVPAWYLLTVPAGTRLLSHAVWLMVPLMAYCAYRLARALLLTNWRTAAFTLGAAVPLFGIVPFGLLSYQAAQKLKFAGIPVGFLGPSKADLPAPLSGEGSRDQ